MSEDIHHECGVAALYWLDEPVGPKGAVSKIAAGEVAKFMPTMLLNLQNRGQLAAGLSSFDPARQQRIDTFKDLGGVAEAFRMSHPTKHAAIMREYAGKAAIGHTRYATCGKDDARYAQPFERHHGRLWKWYSFAFNGNLANYVHLREQLLSKRHYALTLDTDTEILMHELSYRLRGDRLPSLRKVMAGMSRAFDGAYNIVFLDAMGRMFIARDPLGLRPMCWATQGKLFAAASESVALHNLGFTEVHDLEPGQMAIVENGKLRFERFAESRRKAHCFFEWVYFSNVASEMDGSGVYITRSRSGEKLAAMEDQEINGDCVVVPVPDTAKAAADAYAYRLGIPCVEGLMRNRHVGRTFIQSGSTRNSSVSNKYTPLPSVMAGKRVFLVEDSIVRSTTLRSLVDHIRKRGQAKEVHVRVACPPIISPCFYGIDMSTLDELFATKFLPKRYAGKPSKEMLAKMAKTLRLDSLKYLAVSDLGPCLGMKCENLCTGCVTGKYPSKWGNKLIARARQNRAGGKKGRTYE